MITQCHQEHDLSPYHSGRFVFILTSYHSGRCFYFDFHFEEALTNYYSAHSGHVLLGRGSHKIGWHIGLALLSFFVNSY
jgi:hypothetical protein